MRRILALVRANLRKGRGQSASLLVFTLIASLLLSLGLLMFLGFTSFFDKRAEELNAPHYVLAEEESLYSPDQVTYLKDRPDVTEVESEPIILFLGTTTYGSGTLPADFIFVDATTTRHMNGLTLIEGTAPESSEDICLPYVFKAGGGYHLGDRIVISLGDQDFLYTISGFTEEIMFGGINDSMFQVYLSHTGFEALSSKEPASKGMVIRARVQDPSQSRALQQDCLKEFFYSPGSPMGFQQASVDLCTLSYSGVKSMRTMMSSITSVILVLFAAIIALVSLLLIRFRIRNSIEEGMTNIGALKAVGYTGAQLLWATVVQFCGIALLGILAGIGVSYSLLPLVSHVLELQTAMQWQQGFDPFSSGMTLLVILMSVFIVTWLSARRIRGLQPLSALRQGLNTHSFKRNYLPLERSRGGLAWLLALKSALQGKAQMVMILIMVTAVSFAAVAGMSIYVNLGVHSDNFAKIISGEIPQAVLRLKDPQDMQDLQAFVESQDNVRKTLYYQSLPCMIDDTSVDNIVTDDFSLLEGDLLYQGRYPKHDNEVCVSGYLAQEKGIRINDTITVTQGSTSADYLVVGFIQTVSNAGNACAMTIAGIHRILPDYQPAQLYVYLDNSSQTNGFLDLVAARFNDKLLTTLSIDQLMGAQLSLYGTIFFAEAVVLLAITVLVIFLVLYLMLKTLILRQRRSLGIQKALGFTTLQLMNQFALYYLPTITLGLAAGCVLGLSLFNKLFVALTRYMGIMTASLPAPVATCLAMCAALVLLAYLMAMLITLRIRRITPYSLMSE